VKRWLALDLGTKRIGTAVSDPLGVTAQPLKVIPSRGKNKDLIAIMALVVELSATQVVVGLPLNMDGTDSTRTRRTRLFAKELASRLFIPVVLVDERLTSWQAEEVLKETGAHGRDRKKNVDRVAAALILRSALDGAKLIPAMTETK